MLEAKALLSQGFFLAVWPHLFPLFFLPLSLADPWVSQVSSLGSFLPAQPRDPKIVGPCKQLEEPERVAEGKPSLCDRLGILLSPL